MSSQTTLQLSAGQGSGEGKEVGYSGPQEVTQRFPPSGATEIVPASEITLTAVENSWDVVAPSFRDYKMDPETTGAALEIPLVVKTLKEGGHLAGKDVVEIGPGPVGVVNEIFENGNGGSPRSYLAVDISGEMLRIFQEYIADAPWNDRVRLVQSAIENFRAEQPVDTIVGNFVLDNTASVYDAVGNVNASLKHGGVFVGLVKHEARHRNYLEGTDLPFRPGFNYAYREFWRGTGFGEDGKPNTVLSWYPQTTDWINLFNYLGFRINMFDPGQNLTAHFRAMHPRVYAEAIRRPSGLLILAEKVEEVEEIRTREL